MIVVGMIGIILPIMPGWVFLFSGILILSPKRGKVYVEWLKEKSKPIKKYFN